MASTKTATVSQYDARSLFKTSAVPKRREHYPRYSCSEPVYVCEFCHDGAEDLLAYGGASRIGVLQRVPKVVKDSKTGTPPSEAEKSGGWNFREVKTYTLGSRVTSLAWSPNTQLLKGAKISDMSIGLVVACADYKLRFLDNDQPPIVAPGHTDYVNHVAFNVTRGASHVVASVSDDKTCRLWTTVTSTAALPACLHIIRLSSPGIAVSWHREQAQFLMIAERSGQVRLMDWVKLERVWVVSLSGGPGAGMPPPGALSPDLTSTVAAQMGLVQSRGGLRWAEWKAGDASRWVAESVVAKSVVAEGVVAESVEVELGFGAVIGSKWHLWNLHDTASAFPEQSGEAHVEGAGKLRFSPSNPRIFATYTNAPGTGSAHAGAAVRFYNVSYPQVPQSHPAPSASRVQDMSWHSTEPVVVAAAGTKLYFWDVEV